MKKRFVIGISIALVIVSIILFKSCNNKEQKITIETVKVKMGSVSNTVTATGTIEAIKTVAVGTQVSGEIRKIYVDYNSQVKAGQLLAELDRKPLTTALTLAGAALDDAKTEVNYQTANYNRTKALFDKKLVADSEHDLAKYNIEKAKTVLKTAQLNYDKSKINLEYSYIYSPIDGVVLNRAVDEGQTVAASFSTPTLFSIANDLTRMQVEASIDEADIGQVRDNQRVVFTVDAYPNDEFTGIVTQIRLQPVTTSNVVTYTVIVEAPNPEKKLMPGMTASITIMVNEAKNVLTVSSKALRFNPDSASIAAYYSSVKETPGFGSGEMEMNNDNSVQNSEIIPNDTITRTNIWVKNGVQIHPVQIVTGINNDIDVQVKSGLKEGDEVVVSIGGLGATDSKVQSATASSPFMPKPPTKSTKK